MCSCAEAPRGPSVRGVAEWRIRWGGEDPPYSRTACPPPPFTVLGKHPANRSPTAAHAPPTAVSSANGAAAERDSRTQACG
ncbi:hypothetical protein GCM10010508_45190 [Streptomyces naganishii JCM 4654]|uniref:Uncharacterized protein n=1 Tax=Streptomyces naganishii JCM 4654 TaxID=1306179 RepID=A0A918Y6F4_9ACTN|nr:hypothetical protein GCM10010508_45190 [Streptomyces naganishii JCM 4654]